MFRIPVKNIITIALPNEKPSSGNETMFEIGHEMFVLLIDEI